MWSIGEFIIFENCPQCLLGAKCVLRVRKRTRKVACQNFGKPLAECPIHGNLWCVCVFQSGILTFCRPTIDSIVYRGILLINLSFAARPIRLLQGRQISRALGGREIRMRILWCRVLLFDSASTSRTISLIVNLNRLGRLELDWSR